MIVDTRAAKERYGIAPYRSFTPLTSKFTLNKDKKKKKGPLKLIYIYSTRGCRNFFQRKARKLDENEGDTVGPEISVMKKVQKLLPV